MTFKRSLLMCLLLILASFVFAGPAHAYLDPGSGSYIFQLIIAALVGLAFVIKTHWQRIKAFLRKLTSKDVQADDDQES
jgi:hypothetical protein